MEKIHRKSFPRQIQKIMCCNISNPTKWECTSVYFYDMKVSYSSEIRTNDVNDIVIKSNNINTFNCRKGNLVYHLMKMPSIAHMQKRKGKGQTMTWT